MFAKIAKPLLTGESTLHLVVCRENDSQLRVTVHVMDPKPDAGAKDSALSHPVTIVDTPENLDASLGNQLADYEAVRQEARSSLADVTAALKEEAEQNRKKARQTRVKLGTPEKTGVAETSAAKADRTGTAQMQLGEAAPAPVPQTAPVAAAA